MASAPPHQDPCVWKPRAFASAASAAADRIAGEADPRAAADHAGPVEKADERRGAGAAEWSKRGQEEAHGGEQDRVPGQGHAVAEGWNRSAHGYDLAMRSCPRRPRLR